MGRFNYPYPDIHEQLKLLIDKTGHSTLDVIGLIPGADVVTNVISGTWYLLEKDKENAVLCYATSFPMFCEIVKAKKLAISGIRCLQKASAIDNEIKLTAEGSNALVAIANKLNDGQNTIKLQSCLFETAKYLTKNEKYTAVIEQLGTEIGNAEKLETLFQKLKTLDVTQQAAFLEDLIVKTGDDANALSKNLSKIDAGLVEAWEMAAKHADLRTNTTALSKLNDIVGRGRGIDKTKLKAALDGDLGDVLNKATGDDLTNILNRLDAEHVTGSHLDEITSRLNKYPEVKTELLNNPSQFEFFDEVLRNPENYRELAQTGEITTSSKLYQWALGKFRKQILDNAEKLETTVSSNIRNYVDVPEGYKTATQIHLGDGAKRTVPDDFIYSTVRETDPVTGAYYRAIINDSKLHADVPWTDNQYNLIIKKFEDGASYVDLKLRSPLDDITVGQTIRIYKSDVYKSIGTADKSGTYLSTSKVFK